MSSPKSPARQFTTHLSRKFPTSPNLPECAKTCPNLLKPASFPLIRRNEATCQIDPTPEAMRFSILSSAPHPHHGAPPRT